jgi:hypothetical protein
MQVIKHFPGTITPPDPKMTAYVVTKFVTEPLPTSPDFEDNQVSLFRSVRKQQSTGEQPNRTTFGRKANIRPELLVSATSGRKRRYRLQVIPNDPAPLL